MQTYGFRLFSLPSRGSFHLSLTVLSSIGRQRCFALDGGPPSFPQDSTCPAVLRMRPSSRPVSATGVSPSAPGLPMPFASDRSAFCRPSTPAARRLPVWALPFSLAATGGISLDYSSSGYLDVSVRRLALPCGMARLQRAGFPHSDTRGSMPACGSPRLFAACCVLRLPLTPRHPPYALRSLT